MSYAKYVARPAVPSGKTARGNARTRPPEEKEPSLPLDQTRLADDSVKSETRSDTDTVAKEPQALQRARS